MDPVRRLTIIGALALAACAAAAADAQTPEAQQTSLRSYTCQHALDPAARAVSITAAMRPLAGTQKMQMRFQLLKRATKHGHGVTVSGRGLGTWITPADPTLGQRSGDRWVVHHPVVDLAAPAFYRFKVSFRWFGSGGTVLGTSDRKTRTCYQPELRPDVTISALKIVPLTAGSDRYAVVIGNRGKTAAGPFTVELTVGAAPTQQTLTEPVTSLPPHTRTTVRFKGPACMAAEPIMVIVDPQQQVDDYDRTNNTFAETCPGTSAPGTAHRGR
jgi:hypothetical protein